LATNFGGAADACSTVVTPKTSATLVKIAYARVLRRTVARLATVPPSCVRSGPRRIDSIVHMERSSLTSSQPPLGCLYPNGSGRKTALSTATAGRVKMQRMTELTPESVAPDPIAQFRAWYDDALTAGVRQPDAMTLATATPGGAVSARTVLMRGLDERGFAFYTNAESAKAADLEANPRAALVFHWREQERQVRVVGPVTRLGDDEAARYWASRPRGHRLSAWASPQSQAVTTADLDARLADVEARFAASEPPLPPFWGGYVVGVDELELWQGRQDRLHDRVRYRRAADAFLRERLAP
jgi:pyridoxamine 5'-phosphate oxidase